MISLNKKRFGWPLFGVRAIITLVNNMLCKSDEPGRFMHQNKQELQSLEEIWQSQAPSRAPELDLTQKNLPLDWAEPGSEAVDPEHLARFIRQALGWPEWIRFYKKTGAGRGRGPGSAPRARFAGRYRLGRPRHRSRPGFQQGNARDQRFAGRLGPHSPEPDRGPGKGPGDGPHGAAGRDRHRLPAGPGRSREYYSLEPDAIILGPPAGLRT